MLLWVSHPHPCTHAWGSLPSAATVARPVPARGQAGRARSALPVPLGHWRVWVPARVWPEWSSVLDGVWVVMMTKESVCHTMHSVAGGSGIRWLGRIQGKLMKHHIS